jgi:hypothetical protein
MDKRVNPRYSLFGLLRGAALRIPEFKNNPGILSEAEFSPTSEAEFALLQRSSAQTARVALPE